MRFERSWIPGIITLAVVVILSRQIGALPAGIRTLIGAAIAGWLLWTGIQILRGQSPYAPLPRASGPRVQYWRGQRIVLDDEPRRPSPLKVRLPSWPLAVSAISSILIGLGSLVILALDLIVR